MDYTVSYKIIKPAIIMIFTLMDDYKNLSLSSSHPQHKLQEQQNTNCIINTKPNMNVNVRRISPVPSNAAIASKVLSTSNSMRSPYHQQLHNHSHNSASLLHDSTEADTRTVPSSISPRLSSPSSSVLPPLSRSLPSFTWPSSSGTT